MRIEQLEIKNFRCLEEVNIHFPRNSNMAVIIGINGAGKSSLLDAIAKSLNLIIEKVKKVDEKWKKKQIKNITGLPLESSKEDINLLNDTCSIMLKLDMPVKVSITTHLNIFDDFNHHKITSELPYSFVDYFVESPAWICFVYYKPYQDNSQRNKRRDAFNNRVNPSLQQLLTYYSCFNIDNSDFSDFKVWYESEENIENEQRARGNHDYENPKIRIVKDRIQCFFNEFFCDYFSNLRVQRSESNLELIYQQKLSPRDWESKLLIDKGNKTLNIDRLSDGEKRLLMLVTDLSRRLAIANPAMGNLAWEGKGIVLIDEIELHLHPQWQRQVLPALTKTFPNCQFIVTTHSPQVLSEVPWESIFRLINGRLSRGFHYTKGRDSNSILYEVFNVNERPEWSQNKIDYCLQLIDEEKWQEAKDCLQELSTYLGENDTAVVQAQTLLHFMED